MIRDRPNVQTAWTCLAIPLFSMPSFKEVTVETMNYGSVVFVGFVAISAVWYGIWGYKNYVGPPWEDLVSEPVMSDGDSVQKTAST